jgi:hypothetical protein
MTLVLAHVQVGIDHDPVAQEDRYPALIHRRDHSPPQGRVLEQRVRRIFVL